MEIKNLHNKDEEYSKILLDLVLTIIDHYSKSFSNEDVKKINHYLRNYITPIISKINVEIIKNNSIWDNILNEYYIILNNLNKIISFNEEKRNKFINSVKGTDISLTSDFFKKNIDELL